MMGAKPKYLTAGFILEEGLEIDLLDRIAASMAKTAAEAAFRSLLAIPRWWRKRRAFYQYLRHRNPSGGL
jgi:hypothetical protein